MKVVLYLRVSTIEQAEEGFSIRAQKTQLLDYCRVNDYEVVEIYIDDGYSAKDTNRPALKQLLKDAEKGQFKAVLVYKLDRFTRSVRDLYDLLGYLSGFGVDFVSKQEKFDTTTAMGRAMIGILGVFAQFERELISERVRMGQEQKVKEGKRHGGRYPYGYDNEGKVIPHEFEVLRRIRHMYMKERMSYKKIAIQLNQEGITRRGYEWRASTVAMTLENPFYAGIIQYGERMANGKFPQRYRDKKVEVIRSIGDHEPVWTMEEYEEHYRLMHMRKGSGYSRKLEYWFTGLLRCGRCGAAMHGRLTTSRKRKDGSIVRTPYYICNRRKDNDTCRMPIFRQKHIEHLVMEYINNLQIDQELKESEQRKIKKQQANTEKQIQKLKRDLESIKGRKKKWQYMFVEELITADVLRERLDEENSKEVELQKKLDELQSRERETPAIQNMLISMADLWPVMNDEEKKEMLYTIFEEIRVHTTEENPKGVKNKFFDAYIQVKYR
jgi:Site-specific recombinases, DNA invertase Pin homologs